MHYLYQNNNNVNNKLLPYLVNITWILAILMTISDILLNCSNTLWNSRDLVIKKKMDSIEHDDSPAIYRDAS